MNNKKNAIISIVFGALYLLLLTYMIFQSSASAEQSSETSGKLVEMLLKIDFFAEKSKIYDFDDVVRKLVGHFGEYATLGAIGFFFFLFYSSQYKQMINCLTGLVSAALTEIVQIFANARGPSFFDILLNYQGYLTATMLLTFLAVVIKLCRKKLEKEDIISSVYLIPFALFALVPFSFYSNITFGATLAFFVFSTQLVITLAFLSTVYFVKFFKKSAR